MRTQIRGKPKVLGLVLTATLVLLGFALLFGALRGSAFTTGPSASGSALLTPDVKGPTGTPFNFSNPHPVWNTGNLCTVQVNGSNWLCQNNGSSSQYHYGGYSTGVSSNCGTCSTPLTYNFSMKNVVLTIEVSKLSKGQNQIFINVIGDHDVINFNLSGCGGGSVNVTVLGQYIVLNWNESASNVKASFTFYEDLDTFNANVSGDDDSTSTFFVGAYTLQHLCPAGNMSRTDSYTLTTSGWLDKQLFEWVNAVGYNTTLNHVWTSNWGSVSWENTTTFGCSWSNAPASTCGSSGGGHHGHIARNQREE